MAADVAAWPELEAAEFEGDLRRVAMVDEASGRPGLCEPFEVDFGVFSLLYEDLRGGGSIGAGGALRRGGVGVSLPTARMVELDDEEDEVVDSRTAVRPRGSCAPSKSSGILDMLPCLLHVTGGLLLIGLPVADCRREGATSAGERDETELGVVSLLLKLNPGDPEKFVMGLALVPLTSLRHPTI